MNDKKGKMKKKSIIYEDLLVSYGATEHQYKPNEVIFNEGDQPRYYYQIIAGNVKLNHEDKEGKELIQSILVPGESVCELLLFIDKCYPVNAVSLDVCKVLKLPKPNFFDLIAAHPEVSVDINRFISGRLYQKFVLMQSNLSLQPTTRLKGVLNYFKSFSEDESKYSFEITLTRKQLASITALRIETVIRAIKKLEDEGFLEIINRKIFV
jgi:CRP-like cAMP-binding protein